MHYITFKDTGEQAVVEKIICVGRNYAEHAKELGNEVPEFPIIFMKAPSNIIYNNDSIIYPSHSTQLHHEVELVLYIGTTIRNASLEESASAIAGYGVGLDMTLRDLQNEFRKQGSPWTLAKSFDTAAVLSEFVHTAEIPDVLNETITLLVNGKVQQQSKLDMMIFKPAEIVKYISEKMTLEQGDLIYTGTPSGVSSLQRGDTMEASIGRFLSLSTKVV